MQVAVAKRKVNRSLDQQWREKIQVGPILTKLQDHIQEKCELSSTQIAAAKILLGKVMPDVKQVEHTGKDGEALPAIQVTFVAAPEEKAIEHQAEVNEPRPLDEPLTLEQRAKALDESEENP